MDGVGQRKALTIFAPAFHAKFTTQEDWNMAEHTSSTLSDLAAAVNNNRQEVYAVSFLDSQLQNLAPTVSYKRADGQTAHAILFNNEAEAQRYLEALKCLGYESLGVEKLIAEFTLTGE